MKENEQNSSEKSYCCVSCGNQVHELFHQYKEGVIKIIHCKKCRTPVDPYIELDVLLVFIDFLLLKVRAHRHVLFNIDQIRSTHIFKISFALILTNAYVKWFHLKNDQYQSILNQDHQIFYELEYGFYWKLLESIVEYSLRFGIIFLLAILSDRKHWTKAKSTLLYRVLILSSVGQLFVLPLLIWSPNDRDYYGLYICSIFTVLCHSQSLNAGRFFSLCTAFVWSLLAIVSSQLVVNLIFSKERFIINDASSSI